MTSAEIGSGKLLPGVLQFQNYPRAWEFANMGLFMGNSVRITFITVLGELLVCIPAAYAFFPYEVLWT